MGKTIIINMQDICIEGDVLDVAGQGAGIIYNISKEIDDEVAIDYVDEDSKHILKERNYGTCTFFFNLNKLWSKREREKLIKESLNYLNHKGTIYIWDIEKGRKKFINNKVKVVLPNNKVKECEFKNFNLLSTSSFEETKKIVEKYCEIEETKVWEDIFFIKGRKYKENFRKEEKNESITYST